MLIRNEKSIKKELLKKVLFRHLPCHYINISKNLKIFRKILIEKNNYSSLLSHFHYFYRLLQLILKNIHITIIVFSHSHYWDSPFLIPFLITIIVRFNSHFCYRPLPFSFPLFSIFTTQRNFYFWTWRRIWRIMTTVLFLPISIIFIVFYQYHYCYSLFPFTLLLSFITIIVILHYHYHYHFF